MTKSYSKNLQWKYSNEDAAFDAKNNILKNKLGITNEKELEQKEAYCLLNAYDKLLLEFSDTHKFTQQDIKYIHKVFLNDIFDWAGEYRLVDISSPGIRWCNCNYIDAAMNEYEKLLQEYTPISPALPVNELVHKLAVLHGELVVIHPFRDGNGRTARLLCDILLVQSGKPPMEKIVFDSNDFQENYYKSIKDVWENKNHTKLINIFKDLIVSY